MKDRFRFRVWNNRDWDSEFGQVYYNAEETYNYLRGNPQILASSFGELLEDDQWIVEQCTGLRDKDGQLIYENDYIENDNTKDDVYLVVFDEKTARFMAKEMNGNLRLINKNVRVVGNIHEKESK